jgi:hypothetical protein
VDLLPDVQVACCLGECGLLSKQVHPNGSMVSLSPKQQMLLQIGTAHGQVVQLPQSLLAQTKSLGSSALDS